MLSGFRLLHYIVLLKMLYSVIVSVLEGRAGGELTGFRVLRFAGDTQRGGGGGGIAVYLANRWLKVSIRCNLSHQ